MGQKASRPANLPFNFPFSYPEENFIIYKVQEGKKEIQLNTYISKPDPEKYPIPRAIVYFLHGYADYVGASVRIAKELSEFGFVVMGFDHRGFGKSEGTKGYIRNYDVYAKDVEKFVGMTKCLFPDSLKTFFLAYSMGGLTAFYTALKCPGLVDGIMAYAPYLARPADFKPTLTKVVTKMKGCLRTIGRVPLSGFELDKFTDSEDIRYWWSHDPYRYQGKIRIGTGLEILRIHEYVERNILDLDIPVCVLIAEKDKSLDSLKVEEIVSKLSPEQYKFIKYPGCQHDFVYRLETAPKVIGDTIEWFDTEIGEEIYTRNTGN